MSSDTGVNISGNAATATTASRVSNNGVGSADVARHVWFSDSATESARVYDNDFMYNPSTNLLTTNISGNAATASAAQSGSSLETAINGKQDALAAQTAYSAKGSATKVPQITTNALGQVTGITEVTISGVTPASHTHGNITNAGGITASGVTIANGDSLVIVDSSETNKLIKQTSITFDGSTTTKALTQKGTFETFQTAITYMTAEQEAEIVTELGDL
jgi:hypothetical protein